MRAERIRRFLDDPTGMGAVSVEDRELWLSALETVVQPAIAERGARPLRESQIGVWTGAADHRAVLVLGPPGTGKTTMLAWMAAGLIVASGRAGRPCRVLVTAFTRDAIGNLLQAISRCLRQVLRDETRVLFVGREPEAGLSDAVEAIDDRDLAGALQADRLVVGMTSWAIYRILDRGRYGGASAYTAEIFDLLCLDEASQIRVGQGLMSLAPLRDEARLLVAGDDRQLPPIGATHEWQADERQLGGSLYAFLREAGVPEFALTETFRLNRPLAEPPASYFYDEYRPAESVAERRLALSDDWEVGLPDWLRLALHPDHPVCILLHDGPPAATRNPFEVDLAACVVEALAGRLRRPDGRRYEDDLWTDGLAVVTPHRAQNAALRACLRDAHRVGDSVVETVERIQGRERDAIVISYTVSDPEFALAEAMFLFGRERFNVAITRPRSKLVVIVSRRLLEVLPVDEDIFDAVGILREFVFGSEDAGSFEWAGRDGVGVRVALRLRRFDDAQPLPRIGEMPAPHLPLPVLTPELQQVEVAIRELAAQNTRYGSAAHYDVDRRLARRVPLDDYRDLFRLGRITIHFADGNYGQIWNLVPQDEQLVPLPCDPDTVRSSIAAVIAERRVGVWSPLYEIRRGRGVRDRFLWFDRDGTDQLMPILNELAPEGVVILGRDRYERLTVDVPRADDVPAPVAPPDLELVETDFRVLNLLEDLEKRRIDLGIFESWITVGNLIDACSQQAWASGSPLDIGQVLGRLDRHGFVLLGEGRVRSRMAELARELRYVKQRFRVGDADDRPYLVRSLKVLAVTRDKPERDQRLEPVIERMANGRSEHIARVLRALPTALAAAFRVPATGQLALAGFQVRALEALTAAWLGDSELEAAVITADTGSGKTEAACLPFLVGAAIDRSSNVQGTRAVLIYPRVRLAVNQAERLVRYARELGRVLGDLALTVGLQNRDVPTSWDWLARQMAGQSPDEVLWRPRTNGRWQFPFFSCPSCGAVLELEPAPAEAPADRLNCTGEACDWAFDGWVGTKERLRRHPPALFIVVTESLHQWLMTPAYGPLFGDAHPLLAAPRAVLADEVHLYAHVHGAQVGWAIQRLLARCRVNGEQRPLAVGMSATLGDPSTVWGELSGHEPARVLHIAPRDDERTENPSGREYFYFAQPEVESRGRDIAGASVTIQALMCLGHGMRRRTGRHGGFRGVAFVDSIDKLKRLHADFHDAEVRRGLSTLRTERYGPDPQLPTRIRTECCRTPEQCDRFRNGECWYFAATDPHQVGAGPRQLRPGDTLAVARRPVYSATRGNADQMIAASDIVFATSSLEVGFDDPDMTFVYQHYAPVNLASFVQRKGRGGRGADDRPVTGVTLSIHSSRDNWYFRRPQRMLDAADFRVPINMNNVFVRRGQVLSLLLDLAARHAHRTGWTTHPDLTAEICAAAEVLVPAVFGTGICADLEISGLLALWQSETTPVRDRLRSGGAPRDWREHLQSVPAWLYDSINVPLLRVEPEDRDPATEDIGLALHECAPGRVTRRWGFGEAHGIPVMGVRAPMLGDMGDCREFEVAPGFDDSAWLRLIPSEVRDALGGRLHRKILRPIRVAPPVLGRYQGTDWRPQYLWRPEGRLVRADGPETDGATPIHDKSQGRLQGFVIAIEEPEAPPRLLALDALAGFSDGRLRVYRSRPGTRRTGLRVVQGYWCSDVEVVLATPRRDRVYHRQVFVDADDDQMPRLYGYGMQPEGIRLGIASDRLDAFLDSEWEALAQDEPRRRWHAGQFLRYLVMTRTARAGLNRFEAHQLADMMITAAGSGELRESLHRHITRWNGRRLAELLTEAWRRHLQHHPQLTARRVEQLGELLQRPDLRGTLQEAWRMVTDPSGFRAYLRSVVLHSLLLRLKLAFVLHGRGDERQVMAHARLPVQFGAEADDQLTVCERGSGGDGTTRAFVEQAADAFSQWRQEGVVVCPNAEADRILEAVFAQADRHVEWRSLDPRDPANVQLLADELGLEPDAGTGSLQIVLRLLYGSEELQGERIDMFDLYREVRAVRLRVTAEIGREPTAWEVVSTVVERAADPAAQETPRWSRLLALYGALEDASHEETLAPAARLADQVYRISARLCVDGCPGCLHLGSDLMDDRLAEASVSRTLLERFWRFVGLA